MAQGNIIRWYVKEGEEVSAGTVLADIETDKATMAFENQEDGFLAKLVLPEGSKDVAVGTVVAIVVEEAKDVAAFANYSAGAAPTAAAAGADSPTSTSAPAAAAAAAAAPSGPTNYRISPAVRFALAEAGLSPGDVTPTGPNGIITKADVLAAAAAGVKPKPAAAAAPAAPKAAAASKPAASASKPAAKAAPAAKPPPPPAAGRFTDVPTSQVSLQCPALSSSSL
jgi:pyruvate/2-oxoglutarate dehydrogenase complex dihydrolipoamide acyltransferase (E2) component